MEYLLQGLLSFSSKLISSNCLENPHGQRSLVGYHPWGRDTTEWLSTQVTSFKHYFKILLYKIKTYPLYFEKETKSNQVLLKEIEENLNKQEICQILRTRLLQWFPLKLKCRLNAKDSRILYHEPWFLLVSQIQFYHCLHSAHTSAEPPWPQHKFPLLPHQLQLTVTLWSRGHPLGSSLWEALGHSWSCPSYSCFHKC